MRSTCKRPGSTGFWLRTAAAFHLVLASLSCFEQPVSEEIEIRFGPDGRSVIAVIVKIADVDLYRGHPRVRARIEETESAALEGRDVWTRRFEALGPLTSESLEWVKTEGELSRVVHTAVVPRPEDLRRFFADSLVDVFYTTEGGCEELTIYPRQGSRATRQQREVVAAHLTQWSSQIVDYLRALHALYAYLDAHPDRSRACFEKLFEDLLLEEQRGAREEDLREEEVQLLERVQATMNGVFEIFEVVEGQAYSLEELSELVYNPFPARVSLLLPELEKEFEGFRDDPSGRLVVPGLSFWEAFRTQVPWISPDPLLQIFDHLRQEKKETVDLEAFLALPRAVSPLPSAAEARRALEEHLRPAPIYWVRWRKKGHPSGCQLRPVPEIRNR